MSGKADWERQGKISSITTQNVDRLHHKAGSKAVVELHGCAHEVKCMKCNYEISRHDFQSTLIELNPLLSVQNIEIRPDADVELSQELINTFRIPHCQQCRDEVNGFFKPNIVFFGDNVPKSRVEFVFSQLQSSDCLLVLGSSLHVYSGYRFIVRASELGIPSAIVNIGPTRGDKFASVKLNAKCSEVLKKICI
ncbi:NAD-dependent protein deacylase Sirt4-like isoform X2 [Daphnia pulex]|uniref:NAD-dependent protein deacylase Sirt4-like isoform X2 n=1 Tax=Daphnia pulex TaxID=6669 RepID=UPI001EE11731|nr:NAD-dependent protein deacylase Sirt4-like isoform X2 [Daphnia pulex]